MPFRHPEEIGYGHVIERYVTRTDSDHPRSRERKSGRVLRPGWPHAERFARHVIDGAATITDAERRWPHEDRAGLAGERQARSSRVAGVT
jgi:hypothetical protein